MGGASGFHSEKQELAFVFITTIVTAMAKLAAVAERGASVVIVSVGDEAFVWRMRMGGCDVHHMRPGDGRGVGVVWPPRDRFTRRA
jgi:hypothetical protein